MNTPVAFLTLNYNTKTADLSYPGITRKFPGKSRYNAVKSALLYIRKYNIPTQISSGIEQLTELPNFRGPKFERLLF